MSVPEKIPLSELSRGDLEALTERLLAENAALKQVVADLRAGIVRLKGVTGGPAIRPRGMEQKTEAKPTGPASVAPNSARPGNWSLMQLVIDEERVIKVDVPAGSRFKGYEDFIVQDLVLRPHVRAHPPGALAHARRADHPRADAGWAPMPAGATLGLNCAASCCCNTRARSPCRAWWANSGRSAS